MHRNKSIILLLCLVMCITGCIETFIPQLSGDSDHVIVISGEVTDQSGYQEVTISQASPVDAPEYIPVSNCELEISDDQGHTFSLYETEPGKYKVWMDQEFLNPGTSYKLRIITPDGDEIVSAYDLMPECPVVDSVHYNLTKIPASIPGEFIQGLQFYIDLNGKETDSRYYRWNIEETWEHHSLYPKEYYYDGRIHQIIPPDYSRMICWSTARVPDFFTLSTKNLVNNSYKRLPLHLEENTTRLYIGCSVLISQYAISDQSYEYWEQLRINSKEQGGLYERQPLPVQGNLQNMTHPGQKVLGFFGASSVKTRRVFVDGIHDLGIYYDDICAPRFFERWYLDITPDQYPVYILVDPVMVLEAPCYDCTSLGGKLEKPEFWPR
jgi:hypothetical protein